MASELPPGAPGCTGLVLDPLDVLFFRDGRPFEAGYRLGGGLPSPQTLAGALRTAMLTAQGFDFAAHSEDIKNGVGVRESLERRGVPEWIAEATFRGPWLAYVEDGGLVEPLLPVPSSLVCDEDRKEWVRLDPLGDDLPGWQRTCKEEGMRPLWFRGRRRVKQRPGYLRMEGVRVFLEGGVPAWEHYVQAGDLYLLDNRTGIVIDPDTMATEEGRIYSAGMLSLSPGAEREPAVKLYCEVLLPASAPVEARELWKGETVPLGGQSRYVACAPTDPCTWPDGTEGRKGDGDLLLLATPGIFRRGWRPDLPEQERWVAASVADPLPVSGWDVSAGGPRPTRFAVPAGSVYFAGGPVELPRSGCLGADPEDAAQGWGITLKGVWNHA